MSAVASILGSPGSSASRHDASECEVDVALRGGSTLHVRPVSTGDGPAMRAFFEALSPESIGLRFFGMPNVDWVTRWAVDADSGDRHALVATSGPRHVIVAHGAYVRGGGECAEVAFVVADAWQGQGIATIMLGQLAAAAREQGITTFRAEVLPHNHRMIDVFRDSGFPIELRGRGDSIEVRFPTSLCEEALIQFEHRESTAAAAAVSTLLHPAGVAVIGDCAGAGSLAGEALRNLLAGDFAGQLYPIDPAVRSVCGLPSFDSIADVRPRIDLALAAVEATELAAVARSCGAAGVRSLVVLSDGFADAGEEGLRLQRELLAICREFGMRLVGPACLGIVNPAPKTRMHATHAGAMPPFGGLGVLSQSAEAGVAMLEMAARRGIGISSFVSVGSKADLSGTDLLRYWEQDADTTVCALDMESVGDPRRFARIARRVAAVKPVIVVRGGPGGALLEESGVTADALLRQAGVICVDTIGELFDVAALLCEQRAPSALRG
jgi:succinyl-CoA synthetase alpha subunit/GNAT superfamily N-acetyltransferase